MAIGFAIIGCGVISRFHARAIAETPGVNLVACFNRSPGPAQQLAEQFGCTAYENLDAMLRDPRVDAVTIATASGAHLEPAVAAAHAGKHLLVEKPLEVTLRRCDQILAACQQAGVRLGTFFPSRFHSASQQLKKAVEGGRFGRITLADAYVKWLRTQAYYDSGAWRGTWALDGGGALMNQAIHSVDLLCWLMGPVAELSAYTATLGHQRIEVEDVAVASLRFESGALGVIEATTASYPGAPKKIELHGTQGSAIIEEEDITRWDFAKPRKSDNALRDAMTRRAGSTGGAADPKAIGHAAHAAQIKDFAASIRTGRAPAIDGAEGRRAVEIILAIYQSAQTGRPVKLPLKADPRRRAPKNGV